MDRRYEAVHKFGNLSKMRRYVITDINRLLPKSSAKLAYIGNRDMIQTPKSILIEGSWSLFETNFNTVCQ